ncbi:MAG: hypothetical protein ACLU7Z_07195 [Eggerthellaceae bacterium]
MAIVVLLEANLVSIIPRSEIRDRDGTFAYPRLGFLLSRTRVAFERLDLRRSLFSVRIAEMHIEGSERIEEIG